MRRERERKSEENGGQVRREGERVWWTGKKGGERGTKK